MYQEGAKVAHNAQTKAHALALLMLGNTPRYVAAQTGIPLGTAKRWQPEARALVRDLIGLEARAQIGAVREMFPGLARKS